jgi:hypothetical protein
MGNTQTATRGQIDAIMGSLSAEDKKILEAHLKGSKSRRVDEATLQAKYPHMVKGSLSFDPSVNKQFVFIECAQPGCGETRRTFTSDLFQVTMCDGHRKEQAKAKREAKALRIKDLLAKAASVQE